MSPAEALLLISLFTTQFEKDFNVKVSSTYSLEYKDPDVHARCQITPNNIVVNFNHFKTLPLRHQRELIYHELGHCELMLKHVFGYPAIMRGRVYSTEKKSRNWPKLLQDMKNLLKKRSSQYKYQPARP